MKRRTKARALKVLSAEADDFVKGRFGTEYSAKATFDADHQEGGCIVYHYYLNGVEIGTYREPMMGDKFLDVADTTISFSDGALLVIGDNGPDPGIVYEDPMTRYRVD